MKSIFLCNKKGSVEKVYADSFDKLNIGKKVYTYADVLAEPDAFAEVEYVFSTWGMPAMSEEEIKVCFPNLKCVFYAAGSVQAFARPFLHCGVKVFSAWAANAVPVVEYTLAQIILANKGYFLTNRVYHANGNKAAREASKNCRGNYGETVGIIGVLGPRRMDYRKVLQTIEEIGGSISHMMDEGKQLKEGNGGEHNGGE